MKKRKVLAVMLAAACAVGMAACGNSTTDSQGDANAAVPETEGEASAPETEGEASASEAEEPTGTGDGGEYTVGICQYVQHPALDAATQGFRDALTDKLGDSVTFDEQNAAGDTATCATICNQFVADDDDLILANATSALQAAAAATDSIPILATSITDYATALNLDNWTGTVGNNISGTSDLAPLEKQAEMLNELFPDAVNVGIIYCSAEPNSEYQASEITNYLEEYGYTVTAYTFADSNDVSSVATSACDSSDVVYIPTDNTAASCTEAIANVAIPAKTPIVAGEEGICAGCGAVTLSISYYDIGYATGEMAYEILVNGADITDMPVQTAQNVTKKYNAANCEELGIDVPDDFEAITEE